MSTRKVRRRGSGRRKKPSDWGIWVVIAVLIIGIGWLYRIASLKHVDLDDLGCPVKGGASAYTVILVDATDSYSGLQRIQIVQALSEYVQRSEEYERISLFTVNEANLASLSPIVDRCNPGKGDGASSLDSNPRLIRKRWQEEFVTPLEDALDRLVRAPEEAESPILRMIQAVSVIGFGRHIEKAAPKRLLVVSDLLEHTERYSHYEGGQLSLEPLRQTGLLTELSADLTNVEVEILYVSRPEQRHIQGRRHISGFWEQYFEEMGAKVVEVQRVSG